ncbi:AraC family transcriptional regulator [Acetobacterium paludosum]|uniref:AraC family transcriptional regulator n=1 Tax=Acetobacterium paludosum TaxID=52693 RepID=A0A923HXA1_9FIRM|nr:zinc ribbon domain-containing protein [Acetobacterium paludosum]MBC3889981.1 AraC family transcriptional regulator [Acetobacterium paludosum]
MKNCIACGMPMKKESDFAMGDPQKDYCVYCARPDGSMQSFEEKKQGLINFTIKTQGLEKSVAEKAVANMMSKLPAWQEYFKK